ncbi:MAG: 16S rRNA (guanine(966)-N(2))-methyltransferase RsmD [Gammaproteobacteria bacterium]|jgi:16S rRNA (guanine966-N2)-methyltransferase
MSRQAGGNRVRIIGGECRGRLLQFPDAPGLRPTTDRVRETLFNWLQFEIHGARCLDLFAGSGVLGFEAASRGAGHVVLVEQSRRVFTMLEKNRQQLKLDDRVKLVCMDALQWLARSREAFDVIFLDPPFGHSMLQSAIDALADSPAVRPGTRVYIEQESHDERAILPEGWRMLREKVAGQVRYGLAGVEA